MVDGGIQTQVDENGAQQKNRTKTIRDFRWLIPFNLLFVPPSEMRRDDQLVGGKGMKRNKVNRCLVVAD